MTTTTNDDYIPHGYTGPIKILFNRHGWPLWCDGINLLVPGNSGVPVTEALAKQIENGTGVWQILDA